MRVGRKTRAVDNSFNLGSIDPNALNCGLIEAARDNSLVIWCTLVGGDLYALDVESP